ncbi:MAG: lipopolysaccharide assembly protein LapA domain-containing protein [Solirubrobacterales bacterium]
MSEQKQGVNWRAWMIGILVALAVIVALQNSQDTDLDILFINTEAPLIVILLIFLGIGAVIGYVGPLVRRHRRQGRDSQEG